MGMSGAAISASHLECHDVAICGAFLAEVAGSSRSARLNKTVSPIVAPVHFDQECHAWIHDFRFPPIFPFRKMMASQPTW
jgi:hypothetical protein